MIYNFAKMEQSGNDTDTFSNLKARSSKLGDICIIKNNKLEE